MTNDASSTPTLSPDTPEAGNTPEPIPQNDDDYLRALAELRAITAVPQRVPRAEVGEFVPEPIPDDVVLKVRNMLGIQKKSWDRVSAQALREILPRFGLTKIVGRVLLCTGFESLDHGAKVAELGREIMEKESNPTELRLASGKVVAVAVESVTKLLPQLMAIAEQAADKFEGDDGGKAKPKNLPPQVTANVQVNVGGATSPAPPAPASILSVVKSDSEPKNKPPVSGGKR